MYSIVEVDECSQRQAADPVGGLGHGGVRRGHVHDFVDRGHAVRVPGPREGRSVDLDRPPDAHVLTNWRGRRGGGVATVGERDEGVVVQALEELHPHEVVDVKHRGDHASRALRQRIVVLASRKPEAAALLVRDPERKSWVLLVLRRGLQGDVVEQRDDLVGPASMK